MRLRHLSAALGAVLVLVLVFGAAVDARAPRPPHHKAHRPKPRPVAPPAAPAPVAPVVAENEQPGTPGWSGPDATGRAAEVYASATDAMPGDSVALHVSVANDARYRILVYRLGWYGGVGARQVACLPSCGDVEHADLQPWHTEGDPITAGWPTTDTLQVGADWVSGYYLIRVLLVDGPQAGSSATTYLIVNAPSSTSAILMQVPVDTWQAYNAWGGRSLYDFPGLGRRATRVSFDRPYWAESPGGQGPLGWELPFVRFVERSGYDVSYQSDVYTDAHPDSLLAHKLVAVPGHSEYWTKTMRDAFEAARARGVNLAFMGANDAYWQVRLQDGGRTILTYKSMYDPEPDPSLKTAMFRELIPPRYECELIGIQHQGAPPLSWGPGDYTLQAGAVDDRWMRGTGFLAGDVVKGVVSVESDTIPGNQTAASSCGNALTVFFHRDLGGDKDGNADAIRYVYPSGAIVFASGSHQFAWGLDGPDADPRLQAFMKNALDAMTR